jgi:hypothetical protein
MGDRRRSNRYVVPEAAEASLRLMQDVYLEQLTDHGIVVLSDRPVPADEPLALELAAETASHRAAAVSVGALRAQRLACGRHRVVLGVERAAFAPGGQALSPIPSIGVLTRRVAVHVRDISISGCLLETVDPLDDGSIGVLELSVQGERHTETLRVCRSVRVTGSAWPCRAGARFLALKAPPATSVRNVVARFELMDELGAMPEALARVHRRGTIAFVARDRFSWSGEALSER